MKIKRGFIETRVLESMEGVVFDYLDNRMVLEKQDELYLYWESEQAILISIKNLDTHEHEALGLRDVAFYVDDALYINNELEELRATKAFGSDLVKTFRGLLEMYADLLEGEVLYKSDNYEVLVIHEDTYLYDDQEKSLQKNLSLEDIREYILKDSSKKTWIQENYKPLIYITE